MKVPSEIQNTVSAVLSHVVPSLIWQSQRKESGLCLLKAAAVMDAKVDRIIQNGTTEKAYSVDQAWAGILLLKPDSHVQSHS